MFEDYLNKIKSSIDVAKLTELYNDVSQKISDEKKRLELIATIHRKTADLCGVAEKAVADLADSKTVDELEKGWELLKGQIQNGELLKQLEKYKEIIKEKIQGL